MSYILGHSSVNLFILEQYSSKQTAMSKILSSTKEFERKTL
jgi:hypothetical protein